MTKNILTINQALKAIPQISQTKVLVGGCFDILHIGHITFLKKAKKKGDILIVLLESDEFIRKTKGEGRPINKQKDRAKILSSVKFTDFIITLPWMKEDLDYDKLVVKLDPDIIATTSDDKSIAHKKRVAKLTNAKLIAVTKMLPTYSTSRLLNRKINL